MQCGGRGWPAAIHLVPSFPGPRSLLSFRGACIHGILRVWSEKRRPKAPQAHTRIASPRLSRSAPQRRPHAPLGTNLDRQTCRRWQPAGAARHGPLAPPQRWQRWQLGRCSRGSSGGSQHPCASNAGGRQQQSAAAAQVSPEGSRGQRPAALAFCATTVLSRGMGKQPVGRLLTCVNLSA
jgi:hypothetical protein